MKGEAASRGFPTMFYADLLHHTKKVGQQSILFALGKALKGKIDFSRREVFGSRVEFSTMAGPAYTCLQVFDRTNLAARRAVDAWSLCATRLGFPNELILLIARQVWEAREDADYLL